MRKVKQPKLQYDSDRLIINDNRLLQSHGL